MKSGKLALLSSDSDTINEAHSQHELPGDAPFDAVSTALEIEEKLSLNEGKNCYIGKAAKEDVEYIESPEITEKGEIINTESAERRVYTTTFLLVPDEFVIVDNSAGKFLFPLLSEETAHTAFPAEINVDSFTAEYDDAEYWKVGFEGRADGTENGVLHGDAVFNDSEFGAVVTDSNKNQIGANFEYGGELLKLFLTKSGYIEVYQPDSIDSEEFSEFIAEVLLPYSQMK
ncbi:hypothetical protein [Natrinema sp. 74]|uniref:hypothetical protein n=1 Tax=Natrinema sp. 74 TaxID=3384159 RepID=UPI0038D4C1EA